MEEVAALGIGGLTRVASYSEGSRSISFNGNMAQHAALEAEYALTPYGIQYLCLLRRTAPSITSAWEQSHRRLYSGFAIDTEMRTHQKPCQ